MTFRLLATLIILGAAHPVSAFECLPVKLAARELPPLEIEAQKLAEQKVDMASLQACRTVSDLRAYLQAAPQAQPDGSQRRETFECWKSLRARESWSCRLGFDRTVPLPPAPGLPMSEVHVPNSFNPEEARAIVAMVYESLARFIPPECASNSLFPPPDTRNLTVAFFYADGAELYLSDTHDDVHLARGDYFVALEDDRGSPGSRRVKCWGEYQYLD